jgi:two-component system response regulator FlrC
MDRLQSVETYDLLVTDLRMAPVDGVEVIHTARAERPDMEIIVVSGELEHGALAELEELGCHMQIAKPFHPDDVLLSIRQIIA